MAVSFSVLFCGGLGITSWDLWSLVQDGSSWLQQLRLIVVFSVAEFHVYV